MLGIQEEIDRAIIILDVNIPLSEMDQIDKT